MMSDDLVKRLRRRWPNEDPKTQAEKMEAADRIEELEAKLAKAVKALERIELSTDTREQGGIAMAALAELKEAPSA